MSKDGVWHIFTIFFNLYKFLLIVSVIVLSVEKIELFLKKNIVCNILYVGFLN